MSLMEKLHELGFSQIVVLRQDGSPRKRGKFYSSDVTIYQLAALGKDGKAYTGGYKSTYSLAKGESLTGSLSLEISVEEHAKMVAEHGTMEEPKKRDPKAAPLCRNCGVYMRKRSGRRGDFWGCRNYPQCKETLPI